MLDAAASRGLERTAVLARARAADLPADRAATVETAVHFGLIETCVRMLDDPGFVVDIAEHVPVSAYDVMGFAMGSATDLGEAALVGARYQKLYTSASVFDLERSATGLRIWMHPSGPLPLAARCATESSVGQWLAISRRLCGVRVIPESVSFRHVKPRDTARHAAFFGVAIRWEAPLAEMRFRADDLALPVKSRDPALHAFLLRAADTALDQHRPLDTFVDRVRGVVAELLPSGGLDVDRAAARLGTTARTLRRRLAEESTSFSQVRDDVRRALAESYLSERSLPIEEVAFLLDFADERAFRRSFQRWTGKSPARFRADR